VDDNLALDKNDDLPPNIGLLDFELGRSADLTPFRWITDSTVDNQGAWGYSKEAGFKPSRQLVHAMIDQISKNGAMLLNFGPKPDGEIPQGAGRVAAMRGGSIWEHCHPNLHKAGGLPL
jgi:alpha-L-fucosidase